VLSKVVDALNIELLLSQSHVQSYQATLLSSSASSTIATQTPTITTTPIIEQHISIA
jgi:hypothetical protein